MSTKSGLVLHHLEDSRSQRVLWLLEELEVPYTIEEYKRLSTSAAPPELLAIHPMGKSPVITDGDLTLAESGAIVEYLIEKYGNGRFQPPPGGELKNLYYTHFGEGTMMPYVVHWLIFTVIPEKTPIPIRWLLSPIMNKIKTALFVPELVKATNMAESDLKKSPSGWFAGGPEPTAGDFMMLFPLEILPRTGTHIPEHIREWVQNVHDRPAYKRALAKGGAYAYAKL